jgi:hypothetical protein
MFVFAALLLAPPTPVASDPELVSAAAMFATAPAPVEDARPGFSYTYVELNYTRMDPDSANEHIDGLELTGSLGLPLGFFLQATDSQLNGTVDLNQYRVGGGWHFALGSTIDAYGLLSYSGQNFNNGVSDEDGVIGRTYGAQVTPHMYVITGAGTLVYMGGIDDKPTARLADLKIAKNFVDAALSEMAQGKPVSVTTSRPYGCSIKYSS